MTRQRIIVTTLSIVIVVILILGLGGYLALTSSRFAQYAISQIDETAGSSLGARVQIHNLQLHPWQLRVEARGVVVHGTEPDSATPLLTVDRIELTAKVLSLLRRDVGLKEIVVDDPVVHFVQSKDGVSNLPTPP